jgi:tubulin polyglutamylase TTLL6/13
MQAVMHPHISASASTFGSRSTPPTPSTSSSTSSNESPPLSRQTSKPAVSSFLERERLAENRLQQYEAMKRGEVLPSNPMSPASNNSSPTVLPVAFGNSISATVTITNTISSPTTTTGATGTSSTVDARTPSKTNKFSSESTTTASSPTNTTNTTNTTPITKNTRNISVNETPTTALTSATSIKTPTSTETLDDASTKSSKKKKSTKKRKSSTKKKLKKAPIYINLELCKYQSVLNCANSMGWIECDDDDGRDWNVFWTDTSVSNQRVMGLAKHQKINHFPGMRAITHKVPLAKNMMNMVRQFPQEFRHVPKSWSLPAEKKLFRQKFNSKTGTSKKSKTYILKPDHSCQGKGIVLCRTWDQVVAAMAGIEGGVVAQEYITDPLLIEGHKFDLRVYCVVLSVDPLRIYLYNDGLVRICAVKYKKPTQKGIANGYDRTAHLTNYAVNKTHEDFEFNEDISNVGVGNKRTIQWFLEWLDEPEQSKTENNNGHKSPGSSFVWTAVADVVNRTLLSVQPQLSHSYRTCIPDPEDDGFSCFEILGFDIMFRNNYEPILVEVNHSPSLTCDTPLDKNIKYGMLTETMKLVKVNGNDRKKEAQRTSLGAQSRLYSGFKDKEDKIRDAERDLMLREKGWNQRMRKRRAYENKVATNFHLIHPTEEAVALCTRNEMAYIDAQKSNSICSGGVVNSGDVDETILDKVIAPCLDPRRLKTLGRPYKLFFEEASRIFSESTLGVSPSNRRERQLLSSKQPRPLDYSQSYDDFIQNQTKQQQQQQALKEGNTNNRANYTNNVMPVVSGSQISSDRSMHKEYRGEREKSKMTSLQRLQRGGTGGSNSSSHLPHTLGAAIYREKNNVPQNLHRNSVLHTSVDGKKSVGGTTNKNVNNRNFQAYMQKIKRTRDIEQEYRQMINNQVTRIDNYRNHDRMEGTSSQSFVSGVRSSTPPSHLNHRNVRRGLPSMDRVAHVQRPSSMGSTGFENRGGPISSARSFVAPHHDSRTTNHCQIKYHQKYKKTKTKSHKSLRLIGVTQPLSGGNGGAFLSGDSSSTGGQSKFASFQEQQKNMKKAKQVKVKKKDAKKKKNLNVKKKVTVKNLFRKVH